jgi:photosystem II protein
LTVRADLRDDKDKDKDKKPFERITEPVKSARDFVEHRGQEANRSLQDTVRAIPSNSQRRELLIARTACVGFVAAVVGEVLTGRGPLGQLGLWMARDNLLVKTAVLGFVVFNFLSAVNPHSPALEHEEDWRDRGREEKGLFGWSRHREIWVGRLALLGVAAAVLGELQSGGKGPLGQIGVHVPSGELSELADQTQQNLGAPGVATLIWAGVGVFAVFNFLSLRKRHEERNDWTGR